MNIENAAGLERAAELYGLLPFFDSGVPGFSVEDMTPPRYWFAGDVDGPWEWRMEVARRGKVAYGKLFAGKAGFCSREYYPDLANYRRDGYDFDARYEDGLARYQDKQVYDILLEYHSLMDHVYERSPEQSREKIVAHLKKILPQADAKSIDRLVG